MFRSTREMANRRPGTDEAQSMDGSDEKYYCDMCYAGDWCSETEVDFHKQSVHKKEMLQLIQGDTDLLCKMCIKAFDTNDELIRHIKSEHLLSSENAIRVERELFICDDCQKLFFNKKHLAMHIACSHLRLRTSDKLLECPVCLKNCKAKGIWFHLQKHKIISVAICNICLKKCKNRKHLREHLKTHMKYLFCDICQYHTKKEELFKQHIEAKHQNGDSLKFQYRIEKYFMPTLEDTKLERVSACKGVNLMNNVRVCILCRHICVDDSEMSKHIMEHMVVVKNESVVHECVCGEKFLNKVLLKHHVFKLKGGHRAVS